MDIQVNQTITLPESIITDAVTKTIETYFTPTDRYGAGGRVTLLLKRTLKRC